MVWILASAPYHGIVTTQGCCLLRGKGGSAFSCCIVMVSRGCREPTVASVPVITVSVLGVLLNAEAQEDDVATSLQVGSKTSPTTVAPGSWCA